MSATPRDASKRRWTRARITIVVLAGVGAVLWPLLALAAMAVAWGARGEAKPGWFFVVIYTTYGAPLAGATAFLFGLTRLPRAGVVVLTLVLVAELLALGLALALG